MKTLKRFLVFCIAVFVIAGCTKDEPVKPDPNPTPSDSILNVTLNNIKVTGRYDVQFEANQMVVLKWNYTGKVITILKGGEFFSNKTVGDTTMILEEPMTFTFLDANGDLFPHKIGIAIKTEIVLPQIISFTADSYSITRGDAVILKLSYTNGDTNVITSSPLVLKSVSTDSIRSLIDYPLVSTKYTAVVWNQYGSDTTTLDVIVNEPTPLLDKIKANPWVAVSGRSSCYESGPWQTMSVVNVKYVFKDNGKYDVYLNGNRVVFNGDYTVSEADSILTMDGEPYRIGELDVVLVLIHEEPMYGFGCPNNMGFAEVTYDPSSL